jgi:hypothetical protein
LKVFISSLITGMKDERAAVEAAARALGHSVVKAEDFLSSPTSPQKACLAAVRDSDAVVLVLGESYGVTQASGLSATHEEFREAKERCPVFVFVSDKDAREEKQVAFIKETQDWLHGSFTGAFRSPQQLQERVTRALHTWEIGQAAGKVDADDLVRRADALLGAERRGANSHSPTVALGISAGPQQAVLRPAALEAPELGEQLNQKAVFGRARIFSSEEGVKRSVEGDSLFLRQNEAYIRLNGEGSIELSLPVIAPRSGLPMIIEEDFLVVLNKGLSFASEALDTIDAVERLSHFAVAAQLRGGSYWGWRTRREQEASPNSGSMGRGHSEHGGTVHLSPPHRPRATLRQQAAQIAEDLMVLLRRQARGDR